MAYRYCRLAFSEIFASLAPNRVNNSLWTRLVELGLTRVKPTRRGCRSGAKVKSLASLSTTASHELHVDVVNKSSLNSSDQVAYAETTNLSTLAEVSHLERHKNTSPSAINPTIPAQVQPLKRNLYNLPNIFYTNSRSIMSKIDELDEIIKLNNTSLICITETWLTENIPDNCITLEGFNIFRCDREERKGGGICAWIKSDILSTEISRHQCDDYESLWLKARPARLPREISSLLIAIIYRPDNTKDPKLLEQHIVDTTDNYLVKHPDAGLIITGDFNRMCMKSIGRKLGVKQVVNFPTRADATLDLILTNIQDYYDEPIQLPPLGRSDHNSIVFTPKQSIAPKGTNTKIYRRKLNNANLSKLHDCLKNTKWDDVYNCTSVDGKISNFYDKVLACLDIIIPVTSCRINTNDKPWMTSRIKSLIAKRQRAWKLGNIPLRNYFRNKVAREIKFATKRYYQQNLEEAKSTKSWWKGVKAISRQSKSKIPQKLTFGSQDLTGPDMADAINDLFLKVTEEYQPLECSTEHLEAQSHDVHHFLLSTDQVANSLNALQTNKSSGPEPIPVKVLKDNCYELAKPIVNIINSSIIDGHFPSEWKRAYVTPVPKKSKVVDPEKDLRPISVTSPLAKIFESHLNGILLEQIKAKLDDRHFGSLKGSSTTAALVDLMNFLYTNTDSPKQAVRLCYYDLSKGFDRVDHNIVIDILQQLDIHPSILTCIRSFLTERQQRVCINGYMSSWKFVPAGIPQGSVLGPTLFLVMVNSLAHQESWRWKYMDDLTVAESFPVNQDQSNMQESADRIAQHVNNHRMKLNPTKCKEMLVCFQKVLPNIPNVTIEDDQLERVSTYKLLGVHITNNLTWNEHINTVTKKAAKRIYSIRLLKRAGVATNDLVHIYITSIRSIIEYAAPAWFFPCTGYLIDQLEAIQRRVLRTIFPYCKYSDALRMANIPTIEHRLHTISMSYFKQMEKKDHKLNHLFPQRYQNQYSTRSQASGTVKVPSTRTNRAANSFIIKASRNYNSLEISK